MNDEARHSLIAGVLIVALTAAATFLGSQNLHQQRGRLYAFAGLVSGWVLTAIFFALGFLTPAELSMVIYAQLGAVSVTLCRLYVKKG
jgi:amino acid transporter